MTGRRLVSADSHVNEPPDLWQQPIDRAFRDRAPRVVDDIPGRPPGSYLVLEGIPPVHLSQGLGAGKKPEELAAFFQNTKVRRSVYESVAARWEHLGFAGAPPKLWSLQD